VLERKPEAEMKLQEEKEEIDRSPLEKRFTRARTE